MMLLVSGTRHATIADHGLIVRDTILAATEGDGPHEVHVGDARGVDLITRHILAGLGWTVHEYEARWEECAAECPATGHRRTHRHSRETYCPGAGMRRNRAMIAAFVAAGGQTMFAFPAANIKSSGTRRCVRDACKAGLIVPEDHIVALTVAANSTAARGTSTRSRPASR